MIDFKNRIKANIERRLDGVEELDEAAILAEQEQEPDPEQDQEPDLEQEQEYGNEQEFKSRIDRKQEENEKEQELEIRLDEGLEFEDKQQMVIKLEVLASLQSMVCLLDSCDVIPRTPGRSIVGMSGPPE